MRILTAAMRFFRRRAFLGKAILATCMLVLVVWLQWSNNGAFQMEQRMLQLSPFFETFDITTDIPTYNCTSIATNVRITANFTVNNLLDKLHFNYRGGDMQVQLNQQKAIQDYEKATKGKANPVIREPLEIIVVPHSHNDPGWLKTYMKYFLDQTSHILTNIVNKLTQYPDLTFIWVESCFLDTWWKKQTLVVREQFKALVKSGRLEIVSGMWVAPDEASPHYFALIDQMIEGHYWVKKNLGVIPESSLNFDQFGYSATMPYLAKKAGLKQLLIKRIHRAVKLSLGERKWMTFNWRQLFDPEGNNDILSMVDTYEWMSISDSCGPSRTVCRGLDFSLMPDLPKPGTPQAERPFRSDSFSSATAANLHEFVSRLVEQFKLKRANYQPNVMMLPHGGDFYYDKADHWDRQYRNLKLFMEYVNSRENEFGVHMRFGTLKDYFKAIEKQAADYSLSYPTISGDFFTYTETTEYWTGYFTTRMFDKRLSRELLESLRCAELFSSIAFNDENSDDLPTHIRTRMISELISARQNLSIFQHHDAITGTARAHVAIDYERSLSAGIKSTQQALASAVEYLIQDGYHSGQNGHIFSNLQRTGYDELTKHLPIHVAPTGTQIFLVNSLTQRRQEVVSLVVETAQVLLVDMDGNNVNFDVTSTPDGEAKILFEVSFPPVSILAYTLQMLTSDSVGLGQDVAALSGKDASSSQALPEEYICQNNYMNITFSSNTGLPLVVCNTGDNVCSPLSLDFVHYEGHSGAYTMLSSGHNVPIDTSNGLVHVEDGSKQCTVTTKYEYVTIAINLVKSKSFNNRAITVDLYTDLTRAKGFSGDLAVRVKTNIKNNEMFYVDSNGFQLIGRKFRTSLPFGGNVYPMSSMSLIEDEDMRLVVHSAQPHGIVGRSSGSLDLMIDRVAPRPEMGMPEGVTDSKPTKTILVLELQPAGWQEKTATTETALPSIQSVYMNDLLQHPIFTFYSTTKLQLVKTSHSFLKKALPCDIIIANVKNLAGEYLNLEGTSLTLFRRGVTCNDNAHTLMCRLFEEENLQPGALLGRSRRKTVKVSEMYLSHLMSKKTLLENEGVSLRPMDIKTFLIH